MVQIEGRSLLSRQIEALTHAKINDIYVVGGYKIELLEAELKRIGFSGKLLFNENYKTTNTLSSLFLGSRNAQKFTISVDGDLLIGREFFSHIHTDHEEWLGIYQKRTELAVCCDLKNGKVSGFDGDSGYEWTGLLKIKSEKIPDGGSHVMEFLEEYLPLPWTETDVFEIDTPEDLQSAQEWWQIRRAA